MFLVNVHKNFAIIYLMAIFNKKDTLTKTITFMAIMAAINIILSLLSAFVPFLTVFLVIFLPITSALVEVSCEDKYFPIYAFGTIGLCFAVSFWNLDFALFYLVPSILTGYLFGLMSKKNLSPVWSLFFASIAQMLLSLLFVPITKLITERNIVDDVQILLKLDTWDDYGNYVLSFFFLVALVQIILSFIATREELKKLGIEYKPLSSIDTFVPYVIFGTIGLSIVTLFIYKPLSYLLVFVSLFFVFFVVYKSISKKEIRKLIMYLVVVFLNIFVFAIFNQMLEYGKLLLVCFSPLFIGLISLFDI